MKLAVSATVLIELSVGLGAVTSTRAKFVIVIPAASAGLGAAKSAFAPVLHTRIGLGAVRYAACSPTLSWVRNDSAGLGAVNEGVSPVWNPSVGLGAESVRVASIPSPEKKRGRGAVRTALAPQ